MDQRTTTSPDDLRGELRRRLAATCAHFSPADFEALLDRIARTELKFRPSYDGAPGADAAPTR